MSEYFLSKDKERAKFRYSPDGELKITTAPYSLSEIPLFREELKEKKKALKRNSYFYDVVISLIAKTYRAEKAIRRYR